jgi:putative hydrolase of the HAD superfamily
MIKIVFFDFDGVLTLEGHACKEICGYLEPVAKIPADKIEPVFHNIAKQLLVNGKRYKDYVDEMNNELGTSLTSDDILKAVEKSKLNQKMIDVLRTLKNNKVRVGILTDNNIERLEMIRNNPEFSYMSPIIGSSEVGCTKDKCEVIFTEALEKAKVRPEEAIFIDNDKKCLEIPTEMGFITYLHDESQNNTEDFQRFLYKHNLL